jgi:flagella basal body P-ring formation protein FlgA
VRTSSTKASAIAVIALTVLLASHGVTFAQALAPTAATGPTPAASVQDTAAELIKEIQVQVARLVPNDLRIDGVSLGCKPPTDATLKAVAPGITSLTSRSFMVELQSGDRSLYCSAMMNASRQVMTAAKDLDADAPVAEADCTLNWVDAFSTMQGALAGFPAQGPYVMAMPIRAGQPLYQNSLKRPIAIHSGDLVMVVVKNGPITVRAQLQSQSQASVGDSATMINPASGMPVTVTVTGPRLAELVMQ